MDTLHFAVPRGRMIVHHARCRDDQPNSQTSGAQQQQQRTARHAREVLQRTIDEHPLNRKAELFVPRLVASGASDAAAFDPAAFFASASLAATAASAPATPSASTPLFYTEATFPFSSLLSDSFLAGAALPPMRLYGLSVRTPADHCNVVQLTPGTLRLAVDTDTFEALGLDAEAAHSDFDVCSERGKQSRVRERILTIDLAAHARQIALHTQAGADGKSKKGDKRLDRLRWALDRCGSVRMKLLLLDEAGNSLPLKMLEATEVKTIPVQPTVRRFGAGRSVSVPCVDSFTQLLPSLAVVEEVAQSKLAAKRQKKAPQAASTTDEQKASSSSSSFFPLLADGTSSQDIWTDMMTYLGLVSGRMDSCLADPNNSSGSNLFLQQPLCPHLAFHTSTVVEAADEAMVDDEEEEEAKEDEDIISLAPTKKKSQLKRKRTPVAAVESSDATLAAVSSVHTVTWSGLLAPSFVQSVVSRARALLASDSSIPFLALTIFGYDEAVTSWRDKQHQVWMAGSGAGAGDGTHATGGGENHYTLLLLPESPSQRHRHQYVLCTMLGELDRTH